MFRDADEIRPTDDKRGNASRIEGQTSTAYKLRSRQTMCPVLRSVYLAIGVLLMLSETIESYTIHAQDDRGDNLTLKLNPSNVSELLYGESIDVHMTYRYDGQYDIGLKLISKNTKIANTDDKIYTLSNQSEPVHYIRLKQTPNYNQSVLINGVFLGRTYLEFYTNVSLSNFTSGHQSRRERGPNHWYHIPAAKYPVVVVRKDGPLNHVFTATVIILVVLANIAMGCKVDLNVVKSTMKRPIAPCIGFFSQFIVMPLLGFAVSQMFDFEPIIALALLATGCAPGGGASNTYTFLAGGNVSLSVTMTLISILASIAMIPLWLFTLGSLYVYRESPITIPYTNILLSLVGLVVPVIIGLVIQRKRPTWVKNILKAILPLMVILIVLILSVGIYANLYIFQMFQPKVILAGALLPNAGFLLGGLLALMFMQTWKDVKTIAIETGLQNTGFPIVLLMSLPKPESDIAIMAPITAALFTPIILWIFIIMRVVHKRCCVKKDIAVKMVENHPHVESEDNLHMENIPCRMTTYVPIDFKQCPITKLNGNAAGDAKI